MMEELRRMMKVGPVSMRVGVSKGRSGVDCRG